MMQSPEIKSSLLSFRHSGKLVTDSEKSFVIRAIREQRRENYFPFLSLRQIKLIIVVTFWYSSFNPVQTASWSVRFDRPLTRFFFFVRIRSENFPTWHLKRFVDPIWTVKRADNRLVYSLLDHIGRKAVFSGVLIRSYGKRKFAVSSLEKQLIAFA